MDTDPNSSNTANLTGGDYSDESVTIKFALYFNAAKCGAWWILLLLALAYAFVRRRVVSRAWFIYTLLLFVICFNGIQTSAYVGYASHAQEGHGGVIGYLIYLFFFNVGRSTFLAVLLVVASGYCITRSDLGPHKQHVIFVPTTVLVTGLITDFSFFALQSSPDADTYDLTDMSTLAATMWFICSVLNLAALILAWLYLFEALGKETSALEEDYKRRSGRLEDPSTAAGSQAAVNTAVAGTSGYTQLGSGAAAGKNIAMGVPVHRAAASPDVEPGGGAGDDGCETVADHLAYTAKKKLISRFSLGVTAYLISDICVLLLPAFFNHVLQSTLQVLLFVCYMAFIAMLLIIFRPQEQSSYLMVGFSEEDAEERGVTQLHTGIDMTDLGARGHGDDPISRLGGGTAGPASVARPAASGPAAAPRAVRKADADRERYWQIPALPSGPSGSKGSGGALPVSTSNADPGATGSEGPAASKGVAVLPPASHRGRQPRKYMPKQAAPNAGQFTLGDDDDDEDDDASHPLTREKSAARKGGV